MKRECFALAQEAWTQLYAFRSKLEIPELTFCQQILYVTHLSTKMADYTTRCSRLRPWIEKALVALSRESTTYLCKVDTCAFCLHDKTSVLVGGGSGELCMVV